VIGDVGARDIPEIVVFNKADLADDTQRLLLRSLEPTAVFVSARTGEGVDELRARVASALPAPELRVELLVPYDRGEVISRLHLTGRVLSTEYLEAGTRVVAMVHPRNLADVQQFVTE